MMSRILNAVAVAIALAAVTVPAVAQYDPDTYDPNLCAICDSLATIPTGTPCPSRTNQDANPGNWVWCTCELIVRAYTGNRTITFQPTNDQYCWASPCVWIGPARGSCPNVTTNVFKTGWIEEVSEVIFEINVYTGQTLTPLAPWKVKQRYDMPGTDWCGRSVSWYQFATSDVYVKYQIQQILTGAATAGEKELPVCFFESGTVSLPYALARQQESRLLARGKKTECQSNVNQTGNYTEAFAYCSVHVVGGTGPRCRPPCGLSE